MTSFRTAASIGGARLAYTSVMMRLPLGAIFTRLLGCASYVEGLVAARKVTAASRRLAVPV